MLCRRAPDAELVSLLPVMAPSELLKAVQALGVAGAVSVGLVANGWDSGGDFECALGDTCPWALQLWSTCEHSIQMHAEVHNMLCCKVLRPEIFWA